MVKGNHLHNITFNPGTNMDNFFTVALSYVYNISMSNMWAKRLQSTRLGTADIWKDRTVKMMARNGAIKIIWQSSLQHYILKSPTLYSKLQEI